MSDLIDGRYMGQESWYLLMDTKDTEDYLFNNAKSHAIEEEYDLKPFAGIVKYFIFYMCSPQIIYLYLFDH